MAKNPNRSYNVSVAAISKKNKFNLSKSHICTSDFGVLKSIDCRLYVPGDEFNLKVSQFTRLMPMPVPTYGDVKSITRCFVVPINTVMSNWDDFLSRNFSPGDPGTAVLSSPAVPYFSTASLVQCFASSDYGLSYDVTPISSSSQSLSGFDAVIRTVDDPATFIGVKFTWKGRKIVSFLNGLGLNWRWSLTENDSQNISALPLLCWWKFYLDWIVPARFVNDFQLVKSLIGIKYTTANADIFNSIFNSNLSDFVSFFSPISSYYSDDYFTNAFLESFGAEVSSPSGSYDYNTTGQPSYGSNGVINSAKVASIGAVLEPINQNAGNTTSVKASLLNYFSLQSLGILQRMLNRGKLSGTKVQDYLLTTYGLRPNDDVLHLSKYIGSHKNTIQIGDIKATATTDSQAGTTFLGQFAGIAIGGNVDSFKFGNFEEHSYIFLTNELSIAPSYTQGNHIEFTALNRYDFYDPNFDGFGVTQIPFSELGADFDYKSVIPGGKLNWVPRIDKPFGFKPVFAEHKSAFDIVSGDFRCGSLNTGLDSWYLNRKIDADYIENNGDYINRKFCEQLSDANSYDRIFQIANNDSDHFYSVFNIDCIAYRHMISLTDALETESAQDDESHKTVNVDFQGTVNS